jgi:phosphomannomutase
MGVLELPLYHRFSNIAQVGILHASLGFPSPHEANPLKVETLIELQHAVLKTRADLGIAYDGDADRVGLVDDKGHVVPADLILALLARVMLDEHPKGTVFYDLRSSNTVRDEVERLGGVALECRVGHAYIKRIMKEHNAILAGELAGHFYFNEGGYIAEMGSLPAILIMNLMAKEDKSLSQLVAEVSKYFHSGELNFHVTAHRELFDHMMQKYRDGNLTTLDGVKITFPDWWFSLRASNTEPLVRLNLEASSKELLDAKKDELTKVIEQFVS